MVSKGNQAIDVGSDVIALHAPSMLLPASMGILASSLSCRWTDYLSCHSIKIYPSISSQGKYLVLPTLVSSLRSDHTAGAPTRASGPVQTDLFEASRPYGRGMAEQSEENDPTQPTGRTAVLLPKALDRLTVDLL